MTHQFRGSAQGVWTPNGGGPGLDWGEYWVLATGFASDPKCRLFRELDPDWEWHTAPAMLSALTLLGVQSGNWQRSGAQGDRPKLVTPQLLRGETDGPGGVPGVQTFEVADVADARTEFEARRRARAEAKAKKQLA